MAIPFNQFLGQASSGDFPHGLGRPRPRRRALAGTTTIIGQEDLEPGGYEKFAQTTKPNTTIMSQTIGKVPVEARVNVTRALEELEYLATRPGVHPRVLAQRVWQARKALMQLPDWSWGSGADPRAAYDSKGELVARLEAVESVLGVGRVSPKLAAGMLGRGGLGSWGDNGIDPVQKLARCIQGALCAPQRFCCPPRRCGVPAPEPVLPEIGYEDLFPQQPEPEPREFMTAVPPPPPPPPTPPKVQPTPVGLPAPRTDLMVNSPSAKLITTGKTPAAALLVTSQPKPVYSTPASSPVYSAPVQSTPTGYATQATQYRMPTASRGGMVTGGYAPSGGQFNMVMRGLGGLGNRTNNAIESLRANLRGLRNEIRRRS